ncbi:hypothetical protein DRP05_07630 [Archaeoglobales archaeon]|nr:MAG: hypothetical protein DRP05_07630 [Archaeoglobales archaeon]
MQPLLRKDFVRVDFNLFLGSLVKSTKIEERLSKLEKMFYQLYDVVMKKETNFSGDTYEEWEGMRS